jgi:serpin B
MKKSFSSTIAVILLAITTHTVCAEDAAQNRLLADGNNAFAFDLYTQLKADPCNLFFSPYSVSIAMAMMYAGAEGNTAKEIQQTMHYSLDREALLQAIAKNATDFETQQDIRLLSANSVWPQKGHPFLPEYLNLMERSGQDSIKPLDYINAPEESRKIINQWVEEKTQNKITDLIPPRGIDASTRLVLANAIYFLGNWDSSFEKDDTDVATFYTAPNESLRVSMMFQSDDFKYGETEDLQLLEMPYVGKKCSMLFILPKE